MSFIELSATHTSLSVDNRSILTATLLVCNGTEFYDYISFIANIFITRTLIPDFARKNASPCLAICPHLNQQQNSQQQQEVNVGRSVAVYPMHSTSQPLTTIKIVHEINVYPIFLVHLQG